MSLTRNAIRRLVLARRLSLMTPAGRWVARIRCSPSERPRAATSMTPSTNSGTSVASAANSSTTMIKLGGASGSPDCSSAARSLACLRFKSISRRRNSARNDVNARRTRCGDRSVTRPTVCGSATQSAKAAPPL